MTTNSNSQACFRAIQDSARFANFRFKIALGISIFPQKSRLIGTVMPFIVNNRLITFPIKSVTLLMALTPEILY